MRGCLKTTLLVVTGLLLGFIIHGVIEILVIFILTGGLKNFFIRIPWNTWILIHNIFTVVIEILGIFLALWVYNKFDRPQCLK